MSAVLLPHTAEGEIDWPAVEAHVDRTRAAGLTPAVNMDTGYVQLLDDATKVRGLDLAASGGPFVAGAFVPDEDGAPFDLDAYLRAASAIAERAGKHCLDDALKTGVIRCAQARSASTSRR